MGLVLENVSKSYGEKIAVDKISFSLEKPGIFGLLGTNGAGKTTTIRMILGILNKDEGTITWNGKDVNRKSVNFGYLPEERGVYPKTKVIDQLTYFAELKGIKREGAVKAIEYWAKKLNVEEYLMQTPEKLSKGNQQKVQFMTAIVHDPELVILDEPFSGLDPVNTELLKNIIIELIEKGKYIIMSAHQMATIEEFCKDIIILNKGKTALKGNLQDIRNSYPANRIEVNLYDEKDMGNLKELAEKENLIIEEALSNKVFLKLENEKQAQNLLNGLVKDNVKIEKFEVMKPTLNDIFIEKVGE